MVLKNLRIKCILMLHPRYHLVADNLCSVDCLKGCTTSESGYNGHKYHYCYSNNGKDIYRAPLYVKLASSNKIKVFPYGVEYFELANDLYQQILSGTYIPVESKKKELSL